MVRGSAAASSKHRCVTVTTPSSTASPNVAFSGPVLRSLRQGRSVTVRDLARRIGRSECQLRRYEMGSHVPDAGVLAKLAAVLDCEIAAFFVPARRRRIYK